MLADGRGVSLAEEADRVAEDIASKQGSEEWSENSEAMVAATVSEASRGR